MLALQLCVGTDRYAIDARGVVEVVPAVPLRVVPGAPAPLAGLLEYRGALVPVVDLSRLLGGAGCVRRLHTRIAVCRLDAGRCIGVLAERVTRLLELDPEAGTTVAGPVTPETPSLGRLVSTPLGIVQLVQIEALIPAALHDELTRGNPPAEALR